MYTTAIKQKTIKIKMPLSDGSAETREPNQQLAVIV